MKSALWRKALSRYVVPELPGAWGLTGGALYREPADWLACALLLQTSSFSSDFWVLRLVRLLPVARPDRWGSNNARPLGHPGRWLREAPKDISEAEPVMRDLTQQIYAEALPFFARVGTLDGYAADVQSYADADPLNINYLEEMLYVHILRGDLTSALRVMRNSAEAAEADPSPFSGEVHARMQRLAEMCGDISAALDILRRQAHQNRVELGISVPRNEIA